MYTIIETPTFKEDADKLWTEEERGAFCSYLAANPDVGKVIPRSGGCRKIRWSKEGTGKSGGVRVIYFWKVSDNEIWLLTIYGKGEQDTIAAHILKQIAEEIKNV